MMHSNSFPWISSSSNSWTALFDTSVIQPMQQEISNLSPSSDTIPVDVASFKMPWAFLPQPVDASSLNNPSDKSSATSARTAQTKAAMPVVADASNKVTTHNNGSPDPGVNAYIQSLLSQYNLPGLNTFLSKIPTNSGLSGIKSYIIQLLSKK